jgi:hypothetical protein
MAVFRIRNIRMVSLGLSKSVEWIDDKIIRHRFGAIKNIQLAIQTFAG